MNAMGNDEQERAEKRREEERVEIKLNIYTKEASSVVDNSCMRIERKIPNPSKDLVESNFYTCNCLRVQMPQSTSI